MQGQMMEYQLTLTPLLERARRLFPTKEIVTKAGAGLERFTYEQMADRVGRLANALTKLGVKSGDRVATFAWNNARHLEIYFAAPCMGAVLHPLNLRLPADQLIYIVGHADDKVLFVDPTLLPVVEKLAPHFKNIKHYIVMGDKVPEGTTLSPVHAYEDLLANASPEYPWPQLNENDAAAMCYTSGTTGNPKGVVYSHRSIYLHSLGLSMADSFGLSEADTFMPVVPMFHVLAWGTPFASVMLGTKLVFPGPHMQPRDLASLVEAEKVTLTAGVPTLWLGILNLLEKEHYDMSSLRGMIVGGAAAPQSMIEDFEKKHGLNVIHAWGMTEMSPLGTVSRLKSYQQDLPEAERFAIRAKQGTSVPGVDLRAVDEAGKEIPWDGKAYGELQVKGPWVVSSYYNDERSAELIHGRLVPHRGRGHHRSRGLCPDRRPHQRPGQERRRMDLQPGPRERHHGLSQGAGSGGHCCAASQMAGTPAGLRGPQAGFQGQPDQGRDLRAPARAFRQDVHPR